MIVDPKTTDWTIYKDASVITPNRAELKEATGFTTVIRSITLAGTLTAAARRGKRLACLHPFATYPANPSPDLAAFRANADVVYAGADMAKAWNTDLLKQVLAA